MPVSYTHLDVYKRQVYIVFMIIGIIGYFTIPTVAGWIIQAGGMGSYGCLLYTSRCV